MLGCGQPLVVIDTRPFLNYRSSRITGTISHLPKTNIGAHPHPQLTNIGTHPPKQSFKVFLLNLMLFLRPRSFPGNPPTFMLTFHSLSGAVNLYIPPLLFRRLRKSGCSNIERMTNCQDIKMKLSQRYLTPLPSPSFPLTSFLTVISAFPSTTSI